LAKRKETVDLENALIEDTREKRIYGCEEITIGFYNNGYGNEVADFMTMDAKGIIKCYELKVSIQDLKSDAKKSWHGHYNYLVISQELRDKVKDWNEHIPKYVGLVVGNSLSVIKKPIKQCIENSVEIMLKESMIRSMFWKMDKYKNANNLKKQNELMSKIHKIEKERDSYYRSMLRSERIIDEYETYKSYNDGLEDFDLENAAKEEHSKYIENRQTNKNNKLKI